MDSVRRIFFIFLTLLVFFGDLYGDTLQTFYSSPKANTFSLFEENGKVGLKNDQGQVLIPAQHDAIGWSNGKFSVVGNVTGYRAGGRWGLINIQNSRLTKAEFEDLSPGEGTLIVARKKLPGSVRIQAGCINTLGKEVIPFQYDGLRVTAFRAIVYVRTGSQFKHGLIDFDNNLLIPLQYQNIYPLGSLRYGVENFENKTAIFSEDGKQITNFLIDSISVFKKNYAIIYQKQRQGLIDRQGATRLEPTFREVSIADDGTVSARQHDAWLFLDGENKLIRQYNADSIVSIANNRLTISAAGITQLADKEFKPVTPQLFSSIGPFRKGKALFTDGPHTGIISSDGKILIKPAYTSIAVDETYIRATQRIHGKKSWVVLDSTGNTILTKNYEYIGPYTGKYFPVKNRGYWGALSLSGKEIVACVHDSLVQQRGDLIVVRFKGNYGIITSKEDWLVTPQPHRLRLLNDSLYLLSTPKTKFLKSVRGNVIYFTDNAIETKEDHLLEYLPSGAVWKIDLKGIIIDRFVAPDAVDEIYAECEGLRAIRKDGRWGFVDSRGRLRIANRYEAVRDFSESLAAARIRGRWGFINHADQIAVQPVYDEVSPFRNNFATVKQKGLSGVIDKTGRLIMPVRYDSLIVVEGNRFQVKQNGFWGLADAGGKMIVNPKYDTLTDLGNGYVIVSRDGKFGLLTVQGLSTIPQIYDGLSFDPYHNQYMAVKKATWEVVKL